DAQADGDAARPGRVTPGRARGVVECQAGESATAGLARICEHPPTHGSADLDRAAAANDAAGGPVSRAGAGAAPAGGGPGRSAGDGAPNQPAAEVDGAIPAEGAAGRGGAEQGEIAHGAGAAGGR